MWTIFSLYFQIVSVAPQTAPLGSTDRCYLFSPSVFSSLLILPLPFPCLFSLPSHPFPCLPFTSKLFLYFPDLPFPSLDLFSPFPTYPFSSLPYLPLPFLSLSFPSSPFPLLPFLSLSFPPFPFPCLNFPQRRDKSSLPPSLPSLPVSLSLVNFGGLCQVSSRQVVSFLSCLCTSSFPSPLLIIFLFCLIYFLSVYFFISITSPSLCIPISCVSLS